MVMLGGDPPWDAKVSGFKSHLARQVLRCFDKVPVADTQVQIHLSTCLK